MKKQKTLSVGLTKASWLFAFLFLIFNFQFSISFAQSASLYRGTSLIGSYSSVAAAIAAANTTGDSIKLSPHSFFEHDVYVNKSITIPGTYTTTDSSTIDAKRLGRVLQVARGRKLSMRDVRIVNGLANKGGIQGDIGGGIKIDTNAVLYLWGNTIIANNEAKSYGGGIASLATTGFAGDSNTISLNNSVVFRNNIGGPLQMLNNGYEKGKLYLNDNVLVTNNDGTGGVAASTVFVGGNPDEGGIRIVNNHMTYGSAFGCYILILNKDLIVANNKSDSLSGGISGMLFIYGDHKLWVHHNSAKFGGGGFAPYSIGDSAEVIIEYNHAVYGGGFAREGVGKANNNPKKMEIRYNNADSVGGAIFTGIIGYAYASGYYIQNANIHHNTAKIANGIYCDSAVHPGGLRVVNCRMFNPNADGSCSSEIYVKGSSWVSADSVWFGQSDTAGMVKVDELLKFEMTRWVVCDWVLNNGLPVSWFPNFPLAARFRMNIGTALPPNSFSMLQGRFSGTLGSFTPALANMKPINEIESRFSVSGAGMATIMGIVDADPFRQSLTVTDIKEKGFEQVRIYPNPATEIIYIESLSVGSVIELYDMMGKSVCADKKESAGQYSLNINHLPAGNYIIKIRSADDFLGTAQVKKE